MPRAPIHPGEHLAEELRELDMSAAELARQLGVPVVEGIGAPIKMAALLVSLGVSQSRVRWQKAGSQPK